MANWVTDFLERNPDRAGRPVVKRSRYSLHVQLPGGVVEANITGSPMHHDRGGGDWQPIDTALLPRGGSFGAEGVPVLIAPDGQVDLGGGAYRQRTQRVGLFDTQAFTFAPLRALGAGVLDGDQLVRSAAGMEQHVRLTTHGLHEELIVVSMPAGGSSDALVLETVIQGKDLTDGSVPHFDAAGFHFPEPSATDGRRLPVPCHRYARAQGGTLRLYTGVLLADLAGAQFPIIIDPDFADDLADSYVLGGDASSYAGSRATCTDFGPSGSDVYAGQEDTRFDGGKFWADRGVIKFVTSSIGLTNVVDQVNLAMTVDFKLIQRDTDVNIVQADWSANDPVTTGNKDSVFDAVLAAATDALFKNTSAISAGGTYSSSNMSRAYINRTGTTYYGLICSGDQAASPLTSSLTAGASQRELAGFWSQDHANPPVLTILYSPTPFPPWARRTIRLQR